ncbi:hypothetical protein D9M70_606840 [compost metagenome]
MGREHVDPEGRVTLEQRLGRGGQLAGLFGSVLAIDHQFRRFAGEGIGAHSAALLVAGRWGGQAALVLGNAAIGIAGFLCANWRQGGAELGGLVRGYGRVGSTGDGHRKGGGQQCIDEFHRVLLRSGSGSIRRSF